jgi:dTDP-4-dehydrorhamnose 3,5-epimerase-like enzyme
MEIKKIKCIHEDERGSITDIVEQVDFNGATIIESKLGAIRGNHFHKKTVQHIYVLSGKMRCLAQKPDESVTQAIVEQGDLVSHDLLESHSFEALEDTLFLVLSSGLRTGRDYEKDTYRLVVPLADST